MKILLFDMDGVLLTPYGYHRALQQAVALMAGALGFQGVELAQTDIDTFEAMDVTSEWDSSAICAALLLRQVWQIAPELAWPPQMPLPAVPQHDLPAPDFQALARQIGQPTLRDRPPLARAEVLLVDGDHTLSESQRATLREILRHAHHPESSLTHRLFQELVLGSAVFTRTYGLPDGLNSESYLLTHDIPALSEEIQARLHGWLDHPAHRAAIFTNRPSLSPDGKSGTPEAEMGTQCAGVAQLPVVGLGALFWLAAQRQCPPQTYLKPSPVHVLATLRCALGTPLAEALEAAARLTDNGQDDGGWQPLHGANLWAFEDSAIGLRGARAACDRLAGIGIAVELALCGVTTSEIKRPALAETGAQVFPDLGSALSRSIDL